jgi:hypothetical protein
MIKKIIEPTGDVCVRFTDDELEQLGMKQGDKFSVEETDEGIVLKKFATIELDMAEWEREILEYLIAQSCDKDVSVNEVISEMIDSFCKNN